MNTPVCNLVQIEEHDLYYFREQYQNYILVHIEELL